MPLIRVEPSRQSKLEVLARAAQHDLSCACGPSAPRQRGTNGLWIYPAALPSGERVPMLKVLQASGCERSCIYCAERAGGLSVPCTLSPDELARAFIDLYTERRVFGLFLSSAIRGGPVRTMDRMLGTAELLRGRHGYRGYLHLKIIPGSKSDQVERAMKLATRVSVNMEAPSADHLRRIAPSKQFESGIVAPMRQIAQAQREGRFQRAGQTTQLVVGAAGESDREITGRAAWMYADLGLERVYYSALQPLAGTPAEELPPVPFVREHRLYQVDFLLRKYGFRWEELVFDGRGALPLDRDPKAVWAQTHPERFPVEINTASRAELMRVPGIGPRSVGRILAARRQGRIRGVDALGALGVPSNAAARFLLLDGRPAERQLRLAGL
ncbi:MAG: helix-hairpin-helix domain-containing protein [Polyangiaceae bacterium]|nr:helix-hairpin-helix domain-containing protein [Polyangiaceae bacterium]